MLDKLDESALKKAHARLKEKFAAQTEELEAINQKLYDYQCDIRALTSQLLLSKEEERKRIAAQLHDRIGQDLLVTKLSLQKLRKTSRSGQKVDTVSQLIGLVEGIVNKTRELTSELSSPILYELGLKAAVRAFVEKIGAGSGISFFWDFDRDPIVVKPESLALMYRCTCELIVNAVKHSAAESVVVAIEKTGDRVSATVRDDGVGFGVARQRPGGTAKTGCGLAGIKESLVDAGGNVEIFSNPGEYTEVTISAPSTID